MGRHLQEHYMADTQTTLPIADIKPRFEGDTRAINISHLLDLPSPLGRLESSSPLSLTQKNGCLQEAIGWLPVSFCLPRSV